MFDVRADKRSQCRIIFASGVSGICERRICRVIIIESNALDLPRASMLDVPTQSQMQARLSKYEDKEMLGRPIHADARDLTHLLSAFSVHDARGKSASCCYSLGREFCV